MHPIIFDHVRKVVVQVGTDPGGNEQYEELVAAQRPTGEASSESNK